MIKNSFKLNFDHLSRRLEKIDDYKAYIKWDHIWNGKNLCSVESSKRVK